MSLEDGNQEIASLRAQLQEVQALVKSRRNQNAKLRFILIGGVLFVVGSASLLTLRLLYSEQVLTEETEVTQAILGQCAKEKTILDQDIKSATYEAEKAAQRAATMESALNALTLANKPTERTAASQEALEKVPISRLPGADPTRYEALCDKGRGNLEACTEVAIQLIGDIGGRPDPRKWLQAHKWLKWGCPQTLNPKLDFRDTKACEKLGRAYNLARGVTADKELARTYFGLACDLGSSVACRDLGYLHYHRYLKDEGLETDLQEARKFLNSACIGNDALGCYYLAFTLNADQNIDTTNIWRILRKSCELGSPDACETINSTYPNRPLWSPALKRKKEPEPEPEPEPEFNDR